MHSNDNAIIYDNYANHDNRLLNLNQRIDYLLSQMMGYNNDNYSEIMSLIDEKFNINDTIEQFNIRLRNKIMGNSFKGPGVFLKNDGIDEVDKWIIQLDNLPMNATRLEIFSCASHTARSIYGL